MREAGRNPVGHGSTTSSEAASASRARHRDRRRGHRTGRMCSPAATGRRRGRLYRAEGPRAAELDPVVVTMRVEGDAAAPAPGVATLARQVDAGLELRDIVTLEESSPAADARMVGGSVVFGSVLLVALVFSAASLYALMAVSVQRRTREIGIRIALGATPRGVLVYRVRPCRSSTRRRHHRRQQPHAAFRVARRQPDRRSPRLVGDHIRDHGGRGGAGVRRPGGPSAACSTDRCAAAGLTCA